MFCSNCGAEARGNFCSKCGSPLESVPPVTPAASQDWSQEVVYERLIRVSHVRDSVARQAALSKKGLSGEEFLAFFDKVIPLGVSLKTLGGVVQPIYAQLGVKTGKEHLETLSCPPGTVIVRALCSLARQGEALQHVRQFDDGCMLEAAIPSDMWSWDGVLYVSVRKEGDGTRVEAATQIKGQFFDWGKSTRCLETLFSDLKAVAV